MIEKYLKEGDDINLDCAGFAILVLSLLRQINKPFTLIHKINPISHPNAFYLSANDVKITNTLPINAKGQWIVKLDNDSYIGLTDESWKIMSLEEWATYSHSQYIKEILSSATVYLMAAKLDHNNWHVYSSDPTFQSVRVFTFESDKTICDGLEKLSPFHKNGPQRMISKL